MTCVTTPSAEITSDPLPFYIVCRSDATAAEWRTRATKLRGVDIRPITGSTSYYHVIDSLIYGDSDGVILLGHDDIRCGFDFADAVRQLLIELQRKYKMWGICGNAGIYPDGKHVVRYVRDPHGGPDPGLDIDTVFAVDGNLLLLNLPALRTAGIHVPPFEGFHGYDIALSLECWLAGLPVLCDRRLFVIHKSPGDQQGFNQFCRGPIFARYLTERVLNHAVPTLNGLIDLTPFQSFAHLDHHNVTDTRQDIFVVFDSTLAACRRKVPTLTIACRTQLDRPELLERAMMTFAVASLEAPELVNIDVVLVSDRRASDLNLAVTQLRNRYPGMALQALHVSDTEGRYSRVAALIETVKRCHGDYLWFVDDDDFIYPSAIRPLARAMAVDIPRLIVGHVRRFEERWVTTTNGSRELRESLDLGKLPAEGIYHAFEGDNHTPICSVVYPLQVLKERLPLVAARGDYYEDYFILLLALTSPRVEIRIVDIDLCGISLRGGENTVRATDREHWDLSYATFMNEILRLPESTSPLLWQLARLHRLPSGPISPNKGRSLRDRLHPRRWLFLVRRAVVYIRVAGLRATIARIRLYLAR